MNNENCFFEDSGLKPCEEQALDCTDCEYYVDNAKFVLTPAALLYYTLEDFGIQVGEFKSKLWESIFNDFMEGLEKSGYVSKIDEDK